MPNKTEKQQYAVVLQGIYKDYIQGKSNIEVLKDVSIRIAYGEMAAVIGSSGSGKSTLLHIIGLLDIPTKGNLHLFAQPINFINSQEQHNFLRCNKIGFIYQNFNLLGDFTVRENVALPYLLKTRDRNTALEKADSLLEQFGIWEKRYNLPSELSGGQQQRVAIARSMINNPCLILADEPTGNLDPYTSEEVFELFLDVANKQNTAIIMVTHNHLLANKMHTVYKLEYGKITTASRL